MTEENIKTEEKLKKQFDFVMSRLQKLVERPSTTSVSYQIKQEILEIIQMSKNL